MLRLLARRFSQIYKCSPSSILVRPKEKIAIAAGLAVVLSSGVYYAKEHTRLFWRTANPAYLMPFENAMASRDARLDKLMKEGAKSLPTTPEFLADLIDDRGYTPWKANTDFSLAEIVVLGDIHREKDRDLTYLLGTFVRKDDLVLVEASPEEIGKEGILDLRNFAVKSLVLAGTNTTQSIISPNETLQMDLSALKEFIRTEEKRLNLMRSNNPERGKFLSSLIADAKGIVIGVDAPLSLKMRYINSIVQESVLSSTLERLEKGSSLHEFQKWLVYDDLALCARGADAASAIHMYAAGIPELRKNLASARQEAINDNVIMQMFGKSPKQKAVLVLGYAHVTDQSFVERLEKERCRFIILTPSEITFSDREFENVRKYRTRNNDALPEKGDIVYLERHLLPNYVRARVKSGSPPYKGSTTGIFR